MHDSASKVTCAVRSRPPHLWTKHLLCAAKPSPLTFLAPCYSQTDQTSKLQAGHWCLCLLSILLARDISSGGLQLRIIFHIVNGDGCFGDVRCDDHLERAKHNSGTVNKHEESWTNATWPDKKNLEKLGCQALRAREGGRLKTSLCSLTLIMECKGRTHNPSSMLE